MISTLPPTVMMEASENAGMTDLGFSTKVVPGFKVEQRNENSKYTLNDEFTQENQTDEFLLPQEATIFVDEIPQKLILKSDF
jgi:hypothetical protein